MSFSNAYLDITDCLFQSNSAQSKGGALFLDNRVSALAIANSFFLHNIASQGGSVYCQCLYGWATIENSLFDNNSAISGQHLFVDGCGSLSLSSCSLRNSEGQEAIFVRRSPSVFMEDCTFFRNKGAVSVELTAKDRLELDDCCFAEGVLFLEINYTGTTNLSVTLADCCFNATNASIVRPSNVGVFTAGCTFGACEECAFAKTPPPSQTLHVTLNSPATIVMIAVICGVAGMATIGVVILRWRCERGQGTGEEEIGGSRSVLARALTGTGEGELAAPG
jgi:predicted outer membrane repeat protein